MRSKLTNLLTKCKGPFHIQNNLSPIVVVAVKAHARTWKSARSIHSVIRNNSETIKSSDKIVQPYM